LQLNLFDRCGKSCCRVAKQSSNRGRTNSRKCGAPPRAWNDWTANTRNCSGGASENAANIAVPTYGFWSLTRLEARVLLYGPMNAIVHPQIVQGWLDQLLTFQPGNDSERLGWRIV